jgi:hypothetical protein
LLEENNKMAKRLKLQHEIVSAESILIDPMEVIREPLLQDLIFQHLSGSDVKNLFLLSKTWNQAASESSKAMSKITLSIYEGMRMLPGFKKPKLVEISCQDVTLLLNSNRRYKNANIYLQDKKNLKRKKELLLKRFVSLVDLQYEGTQWFGLPILKSLNSRLHTLEITGCNKEEFEYILTSFPVLKNLSVSNIPKDVSELNNETITEFSFIMGLPDNTIKSMKNLKFVKCFFGDTKNMETILNEGKSLERVKFNLWIGDSISSWKIYETMMASDPSISRDIVIEVGDY